MSVSADQINSNEAIAHAPAALNVQSIHGQLASLGKLAIGATARVVSISGARSIAKRLMEMGVVPGAPVRMIKAAPLGDPIEVRVRGYHLALRRSEANTITVELK